MNRNQIEKPSKIEFKGFNPNGVFVKGTAKKVDDIKDVGNFFLIVRELDDAGLPPMSFGDVTLRFFEAQLVVTSLKTRSSQGDEDRLGQVLTVNNSVTGTPSTYSRTWVEGDDGGTWLPWQLQLTGDISVIAPSNELGEKISLLESNFTSEVSRAKEAETELGNKLIKLAGFGTVSAGNTGVTGNGQYFVSTYDKKLYRCTKFNSPTSMAIEEIPYLDGAVYTYNNELYIFNGNEVVLVSEVVRKHIGEVENQVSDVKMMLGGAPERVIFEDGRFIALGGTLQIGDVVDLARIEIDTYRCAVICVEKDDVLLLNVVGGSNARAYAFLDGENRLLYKADASIVLANKQIVVPANAAKMIINDSNSGGISLMSNGFMVMQHKVDKNSIAIQDLQLLDKPFDKNCYTQAYINNMKMVWNAIPGNSNLVASYNTLQALTDKVCSMSCKAIWNSSDDDGFTFIAITSNPNGIHNTKGVYTELDNKPATHINKKSIHPTFTKTCCDLGIMLDGVLTIKHSIVYDNSIVADGVMEYSFGWSVDDEGITVNTPDGKSHRFLNLDDGVDYLDYCGKYCCFEFFNNKSGMGAHPQVTKIEVVQSDGFIIYDNFIRPNGLLGQTPAGFIWHQSSNREGYYSY